MGISIHRPAHHTETGVLVKNNVMGDLGKLSGKAGQITDLTSVPSTRRKLDGTSLD